MARSQRVEHEQRDRLRAHGLTLQAHRRGQHDVSPDASCEHCRFPTGGPLQRATFYPDFDPHVIARQGWRDRVAREKREKFINEHLYGKHKTIRWGCETCEVGARIEANYVGRALAGLFNPQPEELPKAFRR